MRHAWFAAFALLAACGNNEAPKAEAPKAEEAKPAEAAPPAPPPAEAAPAAGVTEEALAALPPEKQKEELMKMGQEIYEKGGNGAIACTTCHQTNGQGVPASFPPLVGQKDFMGDCKKHAGYVIKGLTGEIEVAGVKYNGAMPAQANLTDLQIAAVITYERNSWGNDYGVCLPADVKAAR